MTETNVTAAPEVSEELRLLRKIDQKVDGIDAQLADVKRQAVVYGAGAGGVAGAIAALGVLFAKNKLGL